MNFYLIGIDHNSAALEVREAVHRKRKAIETFLAAYRFGVYALLSTCNRIEVYVASANAREAYVRTRLFLRHFPEFSKYGYAETKSEHVLRHLVRLSAGLESEIKGETQILEQLDSLHSEHSFPEGLFRLWHDAIRLGRYIRLEAGLNDGGRNIAAAVFDDIFKHVDHDRRIEIAVIGTGSVASLFALNGRPEARISFIANKNHRKAKELALLANGKAFSLEALPDILLTRDVIISATKSPHFILKDGLPGAIAGRKGPLYIYDLAVPRDIDPKIGRIDGIILKDIEDLKDSFKEYNRKIEDRLCLAEYITEEAVKHNAENIDDTEITPGFAAKQIGNNAG